jgi:hypothetical protein
LTKFFTDLQPRPDGSFDAKVARWVDALKAYQRAKPPVAGDYPFVMRGITPVRYTDAEWQRVRQLRAERSLPILDRAGLDMAQGDQLLMVFALGCEPF